MIGAAAKVAAKAAPAMKMAGAKLGEFFAKEGVKQAGKRALRDTLLYSAAEQVIPRALGQDAPDIRDTLVRQASGNILAEGVTAGLKGRSFFGEKGMKAGTARKIGEVTGQIGGQAFAQAVLPGNQPNPFIGGMNKKEEDYLQIGDGPKMTRTQLEQTTEGKALLKAAELSQITNKPVSYERPQSFGEGPVTATGATKHTVEPEYNEVVRPSTTDLSGIQAREALSERDKYEYRLKMAQIEKMPSTVMHMSPDSNNQTLASLAQSMMRSTSY